MYLGTCFGVKMSNIDNKNNIDSLNRLPNEGQREFHEEKRNRKSAQWKRFQLPLTRIKFQK
jgi:hypothetical protein